MHVLNQDWDRPRPDEARVLGMRAQGRALVRQVQLLCGGRPWVYARTLLPRATLTGPERRLAHLKSRSLGAVLFADPTMQRGRTEIVRLRPADDLYTLAAQTLDAPPAGDLGSAHGVPPARQAAVGERVFPAGHRGISVRSLTQRLREYALLMRLHRPIGILLLLWPTLWGLWFAGQGHLNLHVAAVFVLGVVLMRSAGCVINDYADRGFDPHRRAHARTADRCRARQPARSAGAVRGALPDCLRLGADTQSVHDSVVLCRRVSGRDLSVSQALDPPAAVLPRRGVRLGIPMAFAAQTGAVPPLAWVLFLANVRWSVAYDTAYAMVDREDDLKVGVKSTAILFGSYDRLLIGVFHGLTITLLAIAGDLAGRGMLYYVGLGVATGLAG